jgi:CheY-like chemotaxis protein
MGARILVADDSVTIQKVVELTFSKEDFVLVQARSGEEAIRKAMEIRPDLALVDLVMPDKNGYEVCAALRAEPTLRSVPIILLTGTFETFDKEQGLRAGANDFVTKPFESQVLISKVKQLLFTRMMEKGTAAPSLGTDRAAVPRLESAPMAAHFPGPQTEAVLPSPTASPSLGAADPASELPPPTEEISQDRLWQLLDSTPAPAPGAPEEPGSLSVEDVTLSEPAATQAPALDVQSLNLEAVELGQAGGGQARASGVAGAEVYPLPESLSLEELLLAPAASAPMPQIEPLVVEAGPDASVFDLTPDMGAPPLALTEVGVGEPPALSVENLLGPPAAGSPGSVAAPLTVPELDLGPMAEGLAEEALPFAKPPSLAAGMELEASAEMSPGEQDTSALEDLSGEASELGEPPLGEDWTIAMSAPVAPVVPEIPPVTASGEAATSAAFSGELAGPAPGMEAVQGTFPFVPEVTDADMASMRQAVTERVAQDLARELSDRLVDRIESIVWEVVPDLAEILITKEIERIRAMAENKKSS